MIRLLAFLLCFPALTFAQDLPAPLSDTVSDYADLLDADEESQLDDLLKAARVETGVHIVVVTMSRREDFGGAGRNIISYAKALFNDWGVGDKTRNDGILILVERDNREMRIALGAGYDAVYDGLAQRVIDREMLPAFRNGNYPAGIEAGAQAVVDRLARPFFQKQTPVADPEGASGITDVWIGVAVFGGIIAIIGAVIFMASDAKVMLQRCPNCGQRSLRRNRLTDKPATETDEGVGTVITACRRCNYVDSRPLSIPVHRPDSSSDSGGFGGGRSSGGGASGKW